MFKDLFLFDLVKYQAVLHEKFCSDVTRVIEVLGEGRHVGIEVYERIGIFLKMLTKVSDKLFEEIKNM